MKTKSASLLMALALALPAMTVPAQDNDQPRQPRGPRVQQPRDGDAPDGPRDGGQRQQRGPRPEGQPQEGQRPPAPPLVAALDTNGDGTIDEKEIAAAAKSLKKLDKNGDGKLTMDELRPTRPMNPQQDGNGGPNGPNGPRQPRGEGNGRGDFRPDGPPPGDGERPARRGPPQPQGDK